MTTYFAITIIGAALLVWSGACFASPPKKDKSMSVHIALGLLLCSLGAVVLMMALWMARGEGSGILRTKDSLRESNAYVVQENCQLASGSYVAKIRDNHGNEYFYGLDKLPPESFVVVYIDGQRHYVPFELPPPEVPEPEIVPYDERVYEHDNSEH
jgi:hypothetical protein